MRRENIGALIVGVMTLAWAAKIISDWNHLSGDDAVVTIIFAAAIILIVTAMRQTGWFPKGSIFTKSDRKE